jgi:hypothetical protein
MDFFTKICDEESVFPKLGKWFTSKAFCIANFELFFTVLTSFIGQKQWLKNNLGTHNSSSLNFLT